MRSFVLLCSAAAAGAAGILWFRPSRPVTVEAASPNQRAFRIIFGEQSSEPRDWSGKIELTAGKVVSLRGWRFFRGDAITGPDTWKLAIKRGPFEAQPDKPNPLTMQQPPGNLLPEGIDVVVDAPETASARILSSDESGTRRLEFTLRSLAGGSRLAMADGEVVVQEIPQSEKLSPDAGPDQHDYPSATVAPDGTRWIAWQAYQNNGDHVYVRHSAPGGWSQPDRLTDVPADVYRTQIAAGAGGRVWAVWGERSAGQSDDWHLYGRAFYNGSWTRRQQLSEGRSPNLSHRLVSSRDGVVHLVWVGHKDGRSHVYYRKLAGENWSAPVEVSGASAWVPDAAVDSKGTLWVAWDSYRNGNYDVFLRSISANGTMGPEMQVTKSPLFQSHASIAVDSQDRVWLAWDESGANWGKDWSHEDPWRGTVLYANRRIRVAVLANGAWKSPAGDPMLAVPPRYPRYVENPKIACDAGGRIWLSAEMRTLAGNVRADYWAPGGRWEHFVTALDGDRWRPFAPVAPSSTRPEAPFALAATGQGLWLAFTDDNRIPAGPGQHHHEVYGASLEDRSTVLPPRLVDFTEAAGQPAPMHPDEAADLKRIREYRATLPGGSLRILRGDFHRHTEISQDGSGDGSIEDYFRYMIDAAGMETGVITDHNAGQNDEYMWWRTEKATLLYHVPGRYTPMFGYERSVPYPNGHRNLVFAKRGVRTLPIGQAENAGDVNSGSILYPYLRQNNGIGMLHSLATGQGSDYRDNDPQLEPLVEIYQGYHASYEYEGAPRAESKDFNVNIHGGYRPLGFWWNALAKGLKLGVQASSDHIGTHNSYTLIYSPDLERSSILESMRARHAYAATDNIVVDFRAVDAAGKTYMMGDALQAARGPRLDVVVRGTGRIDEVAIIKDGKFIFRTDPEGTEAKFSFTDSFPVNSPGNRDSYYYVRVIQRDRNLAWSSPIWVSYR